MIRQLLSAYYSTAVHWTLRVQKLLWDFSFFNTFALSFFISQRLTLSLRTYITVIHRYRDGFLRLGGNSYYMGLSWEHRIRQKGLGWRLKSFWFFLWAHYSCQIIPPFTTLLLSRAERRGKRFK